MSVSKVPQTEQNPPKALPKEFSHPALQQLLASGTTHGSVDGHQLRAAIEGAQITPTRMKVVLRALDEQGITVTLDEETARRAVATTTAKRTTTAVANKAAAKSATRKTTAKAARASHSSCRRRCLAPIASRLTASSEPVTSKRLVFAVRVFMPRPPTVRRRARPRP